MHAEPADTAFLERNVDRHLARKRVVGRRGVLDLERELAGRLAEPDPDRRLAIPPMAMANRVCEQFVITSYSIHYTKLYDRLREAGEQRVPVA